VISRLAALRFFYIKVLKRHWSIAETAYPRKVIHLPQILSPEEVTRLIDAADSTFHRAMLMTLYATGARRAAAAHFDPKFQEGDCCSGGYLDYQFR
jgi:site-specific recombinase XerD